MTPLSVNPAELGAPLGYSNGVLAPAGGRLLFVAGQVGWDGAQRLVSDRFAPQFERALANVVTVVRTAGGVPADLAQLTLYVVDRNEYLACLREIGESYRHIMGRHFPAMALIEVAGLLEPGARVEIQAIAVLPAAGGDDGAPAP